MNDGTLSMPWVFLHAIKDYYDMPFLAGEYNIKSTFNITPTLIKQLSIYEQKKEKADLFLGLWMREPIYLSENERKFVIKMCKSLPYRTMVKPLERFAELYEQNNYTDSELIELEILFLLAFCGNYLRKNDKVVCDLLSKQRGFSQADKYRLIGSLLAFIPKVLNIYKEFAEEGKIELSTTPFAHPILPLLFDANIAKEADSSIVLPNGIISLKDDAQLHIIKALELFEGKFGFKPDGLWPAEGAVCENTLKLYKQYGIKWVATDEDILKKSLNLPDKKAIYKAYDYSGIKVVFRDKYLSDGIGFRYHSVKVQDAISDFFSVVDKLGSDDVAFVILDGENAWEYYEDNGEGFLSELYQTLNEKGIETVSVGETEVNNELSSLKPGSWIFANFNTWIGDKQKNRAWELLFNTKRDYLRHKNKLDKKTQDEIDTLFLKAEASDWFWWYGKGHHSKHEAEFDELFRGNLIKIYELLDIEAPAILFEPIADNATLEALILEPKNFVYPMVDGKVSSFFEWLGSGMIDEALTYSVIDTSLKPIKKIFYGQNEDWVFFRFDGDVENLKRKGVLSVYSDAFKKPIRLRVYRAVFSDFIQIAAYEIIELAISKRLIKGDIASFRFEFEINGRVVQVLPGLNQLTIKLNRDFSHNWFV